MNSMESTLHKRLHFGSCGTLVGRPRRGHQVVHTRAVTNNRYVTAQKLPREVIMRELVLPGQDSTAEIRSKPRFVDLTEQSPYADRILSNGSASTSTALSIGTEANWRSSSLTMRDDAPVQQHGFSSSTAAMDAVMPTRYVEVGNFAWAKDDYSATWRTVAIWAFIIELRSRLFFIDQSWSYPGGMTPEKKSLARRKLAAWTRENLLALGPTFIKLGQLFSTRSDLFPAEVTEELSLLQDQVPAFSPDRAVSRVERELGAPVTQLFRFFDHNPIAAASLGQVHRAVLHSGEQVVVKVQRPGLQRLFDIDLAQLRTVAAQLDAMEEGRDFTGIYAECETILRQEIDYITEGRSANRFRRNFREVEWVKAPRIYWRHTTAKVLTMEYLPGIKISAAAALKSAGIDTALVARRATEAYLVQVLRHSFLHSDPHPGNVMVDTDGSLIFVDFGMMSEISAGRRESLVELFYAVYRSDADGVVAALMDLNIIVPTADQLSLRRAIAFGLANLTRKVEEKEAVAGVGEDLFAIALDQPFRFPASFTFVLRAFTTLEGFGRTLDPDYKFAAVAQPYALELLQLQDAQARQDFVLDQMQKEAVKVGTAAMAMPGRVEKMDETLQQLRGGDLKLRVRALELERAARRSSILQSATMSAIAGGTLVNVGSQLIINGQSGLGGSLLAGSAVFGALIWRAFWRVKRIDKFEKNIRG